MTQAAAEFEAPDPAHTPGSLEPAAPPVLTAGAHLMRAREGAGLSRADVAGKLKFSVKQIEAVETDNFAGLGGPTFVRGLVRTYAKLLNADVGPILAALDRSELPPETGQVTADRKGIPFPADARQVSPVMRYLLISLGVIAAGIALLYIWHGEELLTGPKVTLSAPKQRAVAPAVPAESSSPVNLSPTVIETSSDAQNASRSAAAERAGVPPAERSVPVAERPAQKAVEKPTDAMSSARTVPATGAGAGVGRSIQLSFERDSWVEVKDANGRILFSQLNLAGSQQSIEGRAPFDLVIGNAAFVKVRYRDAPVDLKPYTKAEVARLILN
jgi:cytoskeleton protein RodZ